MILIIYVLMNGTIHRKHYFNNVYIIFNSWGTMRYEFTQNNFFMRKKNENVKWLNPEQKKLKFKKKL